MLQINTLDKLHLGIQGENKATTIRIDMSAWAEEYPDAVFNVIFRPHDSELFYPMVTSYDSETKVLRWVISNVVTAEAGVCETEIRAQDSETSLVKKSRKIPSFVEPSVTGTETEPPEPEEEWVTRVLNAAEDAEDAAEAAETAQGKAEDAQEAAEIAQGKAEDAQEAAEDAQEAAETAQGKAEDAQSAAETAQTAAEDAAENAEAYAIGKRNGTDVPSTDPTYHNNSKYWSDSAWEAAKHAASSTIDDTAGAGTTDKTWSANKLINEFAGKADLENGKVSTSQIPFDKIYPIGSIYMSVSSTSPATLFGGTWERLKSRFLLGAEDTGDTTGDPYIGGATGGAASVSYTPAGTVDGHTLTTDEIPSHNHTFTGTAVTSGGQSANHTHTGTSGDDSRGHTHTGPNHSHSFRDYSGYGGGSGSWVGYISSGSGTYGGTNAAGAGNTGGRSQTHTHTTTTGNQSADHKHSVTAAGSIGNEGGGNSHSHGFTGTQGTINIMPPYLAVYMWKRTA